MKHQLSWARVTDLLAIAVLLYVAIAMVISRLPFRDWSAFAVTFLVVACGWALFRNSNFARRCTGVLFLLFGLVMGLGAQRLAVTGGVSTRSVVVIAVPFLVLGALLIHCSKSRRPRMFASKETGTPA
jgi:hypothetical protein